MGTARARIGRIFCLGLIFLLVSGSASGAAAPSPEPVITIDEHDLPGQGSAMPSPSPGVRPISLPPRSNGKVVLGPEAARVVKILNAYRTRWRYPALKVAADLTRVAGEHCRDMLANGFIDNDSPYRGTHQQRLWQAGISDPHPLSFALVFDGRNSAAAVLARNPKLFNNLQATDLTHLGVGLATGTSRKLGLGQFKCLTVELANRSVELLSPRQQRFDPGDTVEVVGLLGPSLHAPRVFVMPPNCTTQHPPVEVDDRRAFRALVPLQAGNGEYIIEVMPEGPLGPVLTNLLPIYAGVSPPAPGQTYRVAKEHVAKAGRPVAIEAARQLMLTLINDERSRCGLPQLQYSPVLEKLAQGHSQDMHQNRYFAHISPHQGDIKRRAQVLNIRFLKIGENLAINTSVEEAHRDLLLSPAHRSMILDPEVDYVGIGIVQGNDSVYGENALWITQNFARFPQEIAQP